MGAYVQLVAKPGCEKQINEAYARWMNDASEWLVYSQPIVEHEIAWIHSAAGAAQAHLRPYLKTPADWERLFPVLKIGTGQFKVSGVEEDEQSRIEDIKRTIEFVLDHRMLFQRIQGLDDARIRGFTDCPHDLIEQHQGRKRPDERVSFAELPHSSTELYRRCVEQDRPDLWEAYLNFKQTPSWHTWCGLRDKVVPWSTGSWQTVWQLAEAQAKVEDGVDPGLLGRFREGNHPSFDLVRLALR